MKKALVLLTAILVLPASGCVQLFYHGKLVTDETRVERATQAASFDLDCPAEEISASKLDETSYVASGCGKEARYILDKCHEMNWKTVCTAMISGEVREL